MLEYKDLVADCGIVNNAYENDVAATPIKLKAKPAIDYIVELVSGPDFAIRRKSKRREELLIALISRGELRIKDVNNNTIDILTPEAYARFMQDAPSGGIQLQLNGEKCSWLQKLCRGKAFGTMLLDCAQNSSLRSMINSGYIYFAEDLIPFINGYMAGSNTAWNVQILDQTFKAAKAADMYSQLKLSFTNYIVFRSTYNWKNTSETNKMHSLLEFIQGHDASDILDWVGISGIYQIMYEYMRSGVSDFPSKYAWTNLLNPRNKTRTSKNFDLQRVIQYLFYESVEQGFALETEQFMRTWADTLNMQQGVFGEIVDKYPENLMSAHQILSYKSTLLKQQVNAEKWEVVSAEMSRHERLGKEFMIVAPKTPNDMFEEARMQSNCLSSYVSDVVDGNCQIYFLRKRSAPDRSFVTIEVHKDGTLGQVLARFNRHPENRIVEYVNSWWKEEFGGHTATEVKAVAG